MSAGTISIQNNTAAVAGDGTVFTTELSAGDFIVITTGGVTYTLPVKSIESDTALTLARNYNGPAVTGAAWTAMPRDTLNRISAQIAADTAYIIRQRVLEVDNWYQLLEVNGDVTIKMADGSSYTGPSWLKLIDVMKEMQIDELIPIAEQIRADAQQVADDKPVIIQAKDDAQAAAVAAAESENNAAESETNSAASEEVATQKAKEAKESAEQAAAANPLLALQKSLNLSDLADRAAAWLNVRPIGATPLAADAVNDYDAPTWRQVRNLIESGTTGPTMNGVMNYHIGEAVTWETRAYYPPNCLPRDGQLVNRTDWPELWAWAQKTTPITDAAWLADVTKRGSYSTGDGSTTFRLPDWNGVQSGSIPGVFFRGGVGAADMTLALNAAPNVSGQIYPVIPGVMALAMESANGVFSAVGAAPSLSGISGATTANLARGINFSLASGHASYGRNNTGEVVPNKVSGVWLVRASGGFVAANTSWAVINGDASVPESGVTTYGGRVFSDYRVAGNSYVNAGLRSKVTIGGEATCVLDVVYSRSGVVTKTWEMPVASGRLLGAGDIGTSGAKIPMLNGLNTWGQGQYFNGAVAMRAYGQNNTGQGQYNFGPGLISLLVGRGATADPLGGYVNFYAYEQVGIQFSAKLNINAFGSNRDWDFNGSNGFTYSPVGQLAVQGSDVRIKNDFKPQKSGAWERVEAIGICEFKYNGSDIPQRGFLAQQMGDIDPMYVFEGGTATDENGVEFEILNVNEKAVMADMITAIQALQQKVTDLEALLKKSQ